MIDPGEDGGSSRGVVRKDCRMLNCNSCTFTSTFEMSMRSIVSLSKQGRRRGWRARSKLDSDPEEHFLLLLPLSSRQVLDFMA